MNESTYEKIKGILERLIVDKDYKARFLANKDEALEEYDLTDAQKLLFMSLDESEISSLNKENLDEYFSADSAVYTPDIEDEETTYE